MNHSLHPLPSSLQLAVIGGGPAGLRAAEVAAEGGLEVVIYEGKPSVGRKFLVAGKGGLNLTHGEAFGDFVSRYAGPDQPPGIWEGLLGDFNPEALRQWAAGLGIETFQATSGRVYPKEMKAAPLLRRWIERLRGLGVRFEMNHRLVSLERKGGWHLGFANGDATTAAAVVLAMGGGSWPGTGSDGSWVNLLENAGVSCHPLMPANVGWEHAWSAETLTRAEGKPLKNIRVSAEDTAIDGELLVTCYGLEGGAIYQLGAILRAMPSPGIHIDFKPTFSHEQLVAKMESVRRDFLSEAVIRWKLNDAAAAILAEREWHDTDSLARQAKHCFIPLAGPRPLVEAISSAGGVRWEEIDASLMLEKLPGVFVAGEMIDWEAPTGGYLMQGSFATGTRAGKSAVEWLNRMAGR